jgi:tRNA modification GTPase
VTNPAPRSATIAAIASPAGPGARGIVRLSGPGSSTIVRALWVGAPRELRARGMATGRIDDGRGTQPALLLWMPAPRSYTGEDVAELHVPGSPHLVAAVLSRVLELGAAAARPGEFTRRAFENGRIDLTRAEGVLELVAARNEAEARAAGQLLLGGLGTRVDALRDALDDVRALAEASLDFDEADTGHVANAELTASMAAIRARLDEALAFEHARARASVLPRVALAGAPNAGKSTLFNALAGAEHAIVTPISGTTRDVLEAEVELDGARALLLDLPGLDAEAGGVDRAAQAAARERLASADVVLWVVDAAGEERDLARERA